MYKGFNVSERIIHDYQVPETAVVIDAPAGCAQCQEAGAQCQEAGAVQPGHEQCGVIPEVLANDINVFPRLETGVGWFLEFVGDQQAVDKWL